MIELFPSFKYLLDLPELNALIYTSEDSLNNKLDPSINILNNNLKKLNIKPSFQWFVDSDSE